MRSIIAAMNRMATAGSRTIPRLFACLYLSAKRLRTVSVRYENGLWIHTHPEASLVDLGIAWNLSPAKVRRGVVDNWYAHYRPELGDTIVDVGAGTGMETIFLSQAVGPKGRVVAIEAHPRTFNALAATCRLNGLANVTPIDCAVSDRDGTLLFSDVAYHETNSCVSGNGTIPVRARTLDSIIEELGVEHIDFLKMNIEGAERQALTGMTHTLAMTDATCISCHDFLDTDGTHPGFRTLNAVRAHLESLGCFDVSQRDAPNRPHLAHQLNAHRRKAA